MANQYQKTVNLPYFEIQVSNEDPSSNAGRQTIIHRGCPVSYTHLILEALKLEIQQEAEKLYGNCIDAIDQHIRNTYTADFYHTAYELSLIHISHITIQIYLLMLHYWTKRKDGT